MQAELVERDMGYRHYVVSDGRREYRAIHNVVTGTWHITNSRDQIIQECSQKGFAIIAACEMCFAEHEYGGVDH